MGLNVRIPDQILKDPGTIPTEEDLKDLLYQVRVNTNNPPVQTSRHKRPEPELPPIPSDVTHVYVRQHNATGLQVPYEGPFKINSWLSKSTVKLEVGLFKNGEKRFEIRHVNDLKLAHPDSLAAPAVRPRLGRPTKSPSSSVDGQINTDLPNPTKSLLSSKNKQTSSTGRAFSASPSNDSATTELVDHATSNVSSRQPASAESSANSEFQGLITGPPPAQPFGRPIRSTRNPNPAYVDSYWLASAISQFG